MPVTSAVSSSTRQLSVCKSACNCCLGKQSFQPSAAVVRTYQQLLDSHVWWKTMHEDAHGFARTCLQRGRLRGPSKGYFNQGTLKQIDTSSFNEVIEVDVLGPLFPDHNNNSYIFVIVDHFSGFTLLIPTPSNKEADFKNILSLWYRFLAGRL